MSPSSGKLDLRVVASCVFLITFAGFLSNSSPTPPPDLLKPLRNAANARHNFANLPLYFEPNHGQAAPNVQYFSRQGSNTLLLANDRATLALPSARSVSMRWAGASPAARLTPAGRQPGVTSYLLGRDPSQWKTAIPHYSRVRAEEVYPGVDLEFYGNGSELEFDFIVKPGANPAQLRLSFSGQDRLRLSGEDLLIQAGAESVRLRKPVVYQQLASGRREVTARFQLPRPGEVSFTLGNYDPALPLIVDPVLVFTNQLGGTGWERANAVATDSSGNYYITGELEGTTLLPGGPSPTGLGSRSDAHNIFVAKMNSAGTALLYVTILGGVANDAVDEIAVSGSDVFITGQTSSIDFPTTAGSYRPAPYNTAPFVFVSRLNSTGTGFVYSTYIAEFAMGTGIALSGGRNSSTGQFEQGYAYVTVNSLSQSASVLILNPGGTQLLGTYGPHPYLDLRDVAISPGENCGSTCVVEVTGNDRGQGWVYYFSDVAFQPRSRGGVEAVAMVLGPNFIYQMSTYLGGTGDDTGVKIFLDQGYTVIVGNTTSTDFFSRTPNGPQPNHGGGTDVFYAVGPFHSQLYPQLVYSTYLGGSGDDEVRDVDGALVVGLTKSTNFPTKDAFQPTYGGGASDAFVAALSYVNEGAQSLLYSSYFGGSGDDEARGVASNVMVGVTSSTNLPVINSIPGTSSAAGNAFAAKVAPASPPYVCQAQAAGTPSVPANDRATMAGDIVVLCQGGTAGAALTTDFQLTAEGGITSRIVNPSNSASEALLIIDEPQPNSIIPRPVGQTVSGANAFQGVQSGNSVTFSNIPFTQPGPNATRVFRFTNLRVDARFHAPLPGEQTLVPITISATNFGTNIFNASPVMAFVQNGVDYLLKAPNGVDNYAPLAIGCIGNKTTITSGTAADFTVRFNERFPTVIKNRHPGINSANPDPGLPPRQNDVVGLPYQTMTGFYRPYFPSTSNMDQAGLAQSGTRFLARFSNVPSGVRVWVTNTHSYAPVPFLAQPIRAFLTASDANGAGAYSAIPATVGPYAEVPISGGTGTAVWEVAGTDTTAFESIGFGVVLSVPANSSAGGQIQVGLSLAPLAQVGSPLTSYIPRYDAVLSNFTVATVEACGGVRGDFDGSGKPDLVWQNDSTRQAGLWLLGGAQGNQYQSFTWLASAGQAGWSIATVADLDGNNKPDVLWQNDTTRQVVAWYMGGAKGDQYQSYAWLQSSNNPGWTLVSAADLDGNGKPDLIWQEDATRKVAVWYMGGAMGNQFQSFAWLQGTNTPGWSVVGMADLDANGKPDLIWQDDTTRQVVAWYMGGVGGAQYQGFSWLQSSNTPGWKVVGLADLDGNGKPDLLWQEESTRKVAVWYMGGAQGNQFQSFSWVESNGIPGWRAVGAR